MNSIPVNGPFDYKIYGSQNAYTSRTTEFIIASDTTKIEEILIISPSDGHSSCDVNSKQIDGNISIEFQPEEIGLHEIRIFSDKDNRDLFNSFTLSVYDSSKLKINLLEQEAIVGKLFKFTVYCEDIGEGSLNVTIEQDERQLKPIVKQLTNENSQSPTNYYYLYEICFVPEIESTCKVEIEFLDTSETMVYGDSFKIDAKLMDFIIMPFPLAPFALEKKSSFNLKCIRENVKDLRLVIKTLSGVITDSELIKTEQDYYEIKFVPTSIERHFVEIYFDDELINNDRFIKIDIFDVNKIKVKIPNAITLGEVNNFLVDTTDAGEGNLEVIIKDGYDTLKAQLLKRDKRKFVIGFSCDRNMKHEIHVIFNDIPIKDSPFFVSPDMVCSKSVEMISEDLSTHSDQIVTNEYKVVEGGPLDGIQCGEKMWVIFDTQSPPYFDVQFLVTDENSMAIKHTKIQEEGGRWCIEFIPLSMGVHLIHRILMIDEKPKSHLLHKINVFNYSSHRIVYGYKLYNIQDPVQLVFDSANFDVNNIVPEIKDHNGDECQLDECKYLTDYLALKFNPESPGGYIVNFINKLNGEPLASSPYKLIVHENLKEIVKSSGIYDVTRLTIISTYLPENYDFNLIKIEVFDPHDLKIKSCHFQNEKNNLIVEFITRIEGIHKVYLYLNDKLIYDNPFLIYINGDCYTASSISGVLSPFHNFNSSLATFTNPRISASSASNELVVTNSQSRLNLSRSVPLNLGYYQASSYGHGSIYCLKINTPFHFVLNDQNLKGLSVFDSLNEPILYELNEDAHQNSSVILIPQIEGTHKIVGLVEGREIEVQLFVLQHHVYETLFEMDNYNEIENTIERPFIIKLKEQNLEVDAYDPLGERVDVRYSTDNLASFIPHTTGYYRIYISDYHGPILGSPFYALIYSNNEVNDSDQEYVESSGIRDSIRNEESSFVIRDIDPSIDVQIKSPNNDIVFIKNSRDAKDHLRISYKPELIGPHEIMILKKDVKTIGSPVTIYVSDPSLVKINNLENKSKIGEAFCFDIDAIDAGEGFIRVNIKDPKMNDVLPEIIEFDDRKYLVQIMPTNSGVYVFSLTFNKYHIIGSPFKVFITEKDVDICISNSPSSLSTDKDEQQTTTKSIQVNNRANSHDSLTSIQEYDIDYLEHHRTQKPRKLNRNKMEIATADVNEHNRLTPIMDTSEDSSSDEPIFRGEGFIEKVEKLTDGSSNLLLHIGNDSDLSNASDPSTIKGKYKYRLKRIGGGTSSDWNQHEQNVKETNGASKAKQSKPNKADSNDSQQILKSKSKEFVQSVLDNSIEKVKHNDKGSKLADSLPSVSEKKKLFEHSNSQAANGSSKKSPKDDNSSMKTNKVQDLVKQLNKTETKPDNETTKSKSDVNQSKKLKKDVPNENNKQQQKQQPVKNNEKNESNKQASKAAADNQIQIKKKDNQDDDDDDSIDNDDDDEINVVNENIVTKLTKENQKKIDQKKTVVVEEKFVISPKGEPPVEASPKSKARSRSKSKQKDPGEPKNEISKIKSNKDHHLVEREEKSKSFIDKVTKITTDKSGNNKPSEKEILAKRVHIEPNLISSESLKELGDEKIIEKFKPEETIQYEYEQLIEQPDSSQSSQLPSIRNDKPKKNSSKNSKKVENIETKTTQSETKEKFKKTEHIGDDQIKTTTTDLTTYITEEIEDKLTETLENTKDSHEFSYQQRKNRKHPNDSADDLESNMHNLIQAIEPNDFLDEKDNANNLATVKITATREFEFSHQPLYAPGHTSSDSNSSIPRISSQSGGNAESAGSLGSRGSRESAESGSEDAGILKTGINHRISIAIPFDADLNSAKSYNHSNSGENLFDYYKLNKLSNDKSELSSSDKKIILKPVDINVMEHGEDFKAYETISSDDSLNKNITHKTTEVTRKEMEELAEDSANDETIADSDYDGEPKSLESLLKIKDTKMIPGLSLASPVAHFTNITIRNNIVDSEIESNKNKSSDSENNHASASNTETTDDSGNENKSPEQIKYYYQPIERMTVEDFFDGSSNASSLKAEPNSSKTGIVTGQQKSLDELKAKFERKDSHMDEQLKRAKPEDPKSFNLKDGKSIPAKLPKSKVEIYDSQKSELTSNDPELKNNKKARFNNKKPSNDDKLIESNLTAKPDKSKLTNRTLASERPQKETTNEVSEIEDKRSKLRKTPHTYPIEDEPSDKFVTRSVTDYPSTDEHVNKLSSEDEFSIFKRPNKSVTVASSEQNSEQSKIDKGVKSLLNVYEKKADILPKNENKLLKLKSDEGRDITEQTNTNIKKLPKSTVSLFDKKEPEPQPPTSNKQKTESIEKKKQPTKELDPPQSILLPKKELEQISHDNVKPSSYLRSVEKVSEPESLKDSKKIEEPKKLSKTKLELYEQKPDEEIAAAIRTLKPVVPKLQSNQEEKGKRNELEKQSGDKLVKSTAEIPQLQKNSQEKIKEPSLDKLKKSDRVDKTEKPTDNLKPDKSSKLTPSNNKQDETSAAVVQTLVTDEQSEETIPKSFKKLVNKYETKPSHNQADDKGDDKITKKKSKLSSQSSSSESSRHSDIKSSSSDVTLDKLKPSADDKSIKQLIGKYEPPIAASKAKESNEPKSISATLNSTLNSSFDTSLSKYSDLNTLSENDIKTEKAIQKLVDIYAQKNAGGPNKSEPDPLQPIYYDFPNYYNFPSNVNVQGTPTYNNQNYDYSAQFEQKPEQKQKHSGQKTPDYHIEKSRPLEAIKEVDSRSDHFEEFYEDQYFDGEDTDKEFDSSKKDNQIFSGFDDNQSNQMNTSDLNTSKADTTTANTTLNTNTISIQDRPLSSTSIFKTNNSDLTAIVHINNTNINKSQVNKKEGKEGKEENASEQKIEISERRKSRDFKQKETKTPESLETTISNKDFSYFSQPRENSNSESKEDNSYLSVNDYFNDLSKISQTKLTRNSSAESSHPIEVQLEVEYKKPLEFTVTKTREKQALEYKSLAEFNDRHIIRFNYKTVVDFTIGVKNKPSFTSFYGEEYNEQNLKAEIEITVYGEFMFQIIRKDNRKPIEIKVLPKMKNTYRIQFQPSPITSYILKALPITN